MGLNFYKGIRLGGGMRLNLTKSGIGISTGIPFVRFAVGPRGGRFQATLPGTGIYYRKYFSLSPSAKHTNSNTSSADSAFDLAPDNTNIPNITQESLPVLPSIQQDIRVVAFREAFKFLETNRFDVAIKYFDFIISKDPTAADAHFAKGITLYRISNCQKAMESLLKANEYHENLQELYTNATVQEDLQLQITAEISVGINPDLIGVNLLLAEIFQDMGSAKHAVALLLSFYRINSDDAILISLLELILKTKSQRKVVNSILKKAKSDIGSKPISIQILVRAYIILCHVEYKIAFPPSLVIMQESELNSCDKFSIVCFYYFSLAVYAKQSQKPFEAYLKQALLGLPDHALLNRYFPEWKVN